MVDMTLSVRLGRELLGLDELECNDHLAYAVAPSFLGAQVSWVRQQVSSPYMDDDITTSMRRGKVTEPFTVEVYGRSQASPNVASAAVMNANLGELLSALRQQRYDLTVEADGHVRVFACEAADYQVSFTGPRMVARQLQVAAMVPRAPVPKLGVA